MVVLLKHGLVLTFPDDHAMRFGDDRLYVVVNRLGDLVADISSTQFVAMFKKTEGYIYSVGQEIIRNMGKEANDDSRI